MTASVYELGAFYLLRNDRESSIFDVWERGEAYGDSVTPSTYSTAYRCWMRDKLLSILRLYGVPRLLSLGCGNAVIEGELAARGVDVLAIDAMAEAVALAKRKGLRAYQADINVWAPEPEPCSVVYADGLLGHLYDVETGTLPILRRIRSWISSGTLVVSNDSTKDGSDAQPAPGVNGFYWLSGSYLWEQANLAGFRNVTTDVFSYNRPVSGPRLRTILIAHV